MDLNRKIELNRFIGKATKATYAGGGGKVDQPHRSGFNELEYLEEDWYYRDSYTGFLRSWGQEVVWYKGEPYWTCLYGGGMASNKLDHNMAVAIDRHNRYVGGDLSDNTYGALGYAIVGLYEKYGERPARWAITPRNGQIMDTFPEKRRSNSQLKSSAIAVAGGSLHYRYELDTSADESESLVKSGIGSPILWSGAITNGISAASENSMQSLSAILDSNGNFAFARNTYAENALGRAAVELHNRFNSMPYAWVAMDGLRVRHT